MQGAGGDSRKGSGRGPNRPQAARGPGDRGVGARYDQACGKTGNPNSWRPRRGRSHRAVPHQRRVDPGCHPGPGARRHRGSHESGARERMATLPATTEDQRG